jgi:hypothetical protein
MNASLVVSVYSWLVSGCSSSGTEEAMHVGRYQGPVGLVHLARVFIVAGCAIIIGGCSGVNTLPTCEKMGMPAMTPKSENVYYDEGRKVYIYCAGYGGRCVDGGMSCIVEPR